jgi:hypothetical protein
MFLAFPQFCPRASEILFAPQGTEPQRKKKDKKRISLFTLSLCGAIVQTESECTVMR